MDIKIPQENIPAANLNVYLHIYGELRTIRSQLSHIIAKQDGLTFEEVDQKFGKVGESQYEELWTSLMAKLGQ